MVGKNRYAISEVSKEVSKDSIWEKNDSKLILFNYKDEKSISDADVPLRQKIFTVDVKIGQKNGFSLIHNLGCCYCV